MSIQAPLIQFIQATATHHCQYQYPTTGYPWFHVLRTQWESYSRTITRWYRTCIRWREKNTATSSATKCRKQRHRAAYWNQWMFSSSSCESVGMIICFNKGICQLSQLNKHLWSYCCYIRWFKLYFFIWISSLLDTDHKSDDSCEIRIAIALDLALHRRLQDTLSKKIDLS